MGEWFGWAGKILEIDLTNAKIQKNSLSEDLALNFLGGRGFNVKTLWERIKPGVDPLSPENILCFSAGPLVGTIVGLTCRLSVGAKSPSAKKIESKIF